MKNSRFKVLAENVLDSSRSGKCLLQKKEFCQLIFSLLIFSFFSLSRHQLALRQRPGQVRESVLLPFPVLPERLAPHDIRRVPCLTLDVHHCKARNIPKLFSYRTVY